VAGGKVGRDGRGEGGKRKVRARRGEGSTGKRLEEVMVGKRKEKEE
jgi:hypothetical protein